MELKFDETLAGRYTSGSQRARILTEKWAGDFAFCPNCGNSSVNKYPNNRPVADFYCSNCFEEFELKSKNGNLGSKVVDGAYRTMIERLASESNPNFFLMSYKPASLEVEDFLVIPKHFFVPENIEKRKPLALTARRAGWVGCNILLERIPRAGKIFIVRGQQVIDRTAVLAEWQRTLFLREQEETAAKGWLVDIMRMVEKINKREFTLSQVYEFENELSKLHPYNKHVKDKIRQQLQILRDNNYLEFLGSGKYRLI